VTHTAEVDVNKAVIGSLHVPLLEDIGNINNNAPRVMTAKKPRHIVLAGFTLIFASYKFNLTALCADIKTRQKFKRDAKHYVKCAKMLIADLA
jgi:hypothetical protein